MRKAPTLLALLGAALAAVALWRAADAPPRRPPREATPAREAPPASTAAPGPRPHPAAPPAPAATRPATAPPSDVPPSPAPGRAFRAEHDNSTAGVIDPAPPADAATWSARRREAALAWEQGSLDVARAFAQELGLTRTESASVAQALRGFHADMAQLRADRTSGALSGGAFRDRATEARAAARAAVEQALGPARAAALRERLDAEIPGGSF